MFNNYPTPILFALLFTTSLTAQANENNRVLEEVLVTGGKPEVITATGSVQLIDEESLEAFDLVDLNQVLSRAPGIYIRQEDGYGLRPNIGIRGATSDRSQKITLMEDGILIAPAPYTAPAAYYLPNVSRMQGVEVLKGPASIKYGPHTVGGAINMATRSIEESLNEFELSLGSDDFHKLQLFHSKNTERLGYYIEALNFGSAGFKELENDEDTGFTRNDINTKLQLRNNDIDMPQQLTIKLGYADETSHETYLGLTDSDFEKNPYRRYAASQLDEFVSEHMQLHTDYSIGLADNITLRNKLYYNRFERSWNKFDGFIGGFTDCNNNTQQAGENCLSADEILENPTLFTREIAIIRGELDSQNGDVNDLVDITDNDREYGSMGYEAEADINIPGNTFNHDIVIGLRYHHDYVERNHTSRGYEMIDGRLVNPVNYGAKLYNEANSDAVAAFIQHTLGWNDLEITSGLRYEDISGEAENLETGENTENSQSILIPGIGVFWQANEYLGLLGGINKGFSPAGPGAGKQVDPEESINYELGGRFSYHAFYGEVIGFYSDYSNLLGRCRVSDSGCNPGDEFNGGSVDIAGVEINASYLAELENGLSIPVELVYTYTESAFQESFASSFSQWGNVDKGDELPYLPENTWRLQTGIRASNWDLLLAIKHSDAMREIPGQRDISDAQHTDSLTTYDLSGSYFINADFMVQLVIENLTDEVAIVSHRPFGARPNKPRSVVTRVKYSF